MVKYDLIPEQLLYEGTISSGNIFSPEPLERDRIALTHDNDYLTKLDSGTMSESEVRRMGFPYSKALIHREKVIINGTLMGAGFALKDGVALNVAGGTHHAFRDRAEGFCILNDIAVAANCLINDRIVKKILVVDLDVHQGNGTASIFHDHPGVFTFSMHGKNNYPMHKIASDLDVPLEDGMDDETYLKILQYHLPRLLDEEQPDLVFYQSGVDVLESDKLGRLKLSVHGCKQRDKMVFTLCKRAHVPVVACMGGGYSHKLSDIIEAHANTFRTAVEVFF